MKTILLIFAILLLSNCSTTPDSVGKHTDVGIWQGKVQMTNKKTNHKKWANVIWASDSNNQRMRIDVQAVFDMPVATFIKDGADNHLWLFTENKYFYSEDGEKLFKHLTKLSIDPSIFYSLLGHPQPPSEQWKCNDKAEVFQCVSQESKTRFSVKHQKKDHRIIKMFKGSKALRIRLFRSKVQVSSKLFKPLSTSHFKTIKI